MDTSNLRRPLLAVASVLLMGISSLAAAEPPLRAARLGDLDGSVSFSPAGEPDWVRAVVNRPLTTGDRLWTSSRSRAEVQIGGAAIRMGPSTSMVLLNLDNRIAQVQLSQGALKIRVRSLGPRQTFEVATPNLAFTLRRPGEYRVEVDPHDDATAVMVTRGEAEVYGDGASYTVDSRRAYRFYGTGLSDYETLAAQRDDDLDRWSRERDRRADNSVSARYVSSEVVGYEDLDASGTWRVDVTYGPVWTPARVAPGWTPYRDGHWSWIDPWGWTWVDDAPWGYAVSHYGRWARIDNSWGWVPGPRRERAVYAPALVAFIGGRNFQVSVSIGGTSPANVGWFPLAPREVYQPSYPVSRSYFDSINRSNAVIAPTTITNVYNTTIVSNTTQVTNVIYANQQVTGAVVAVPTQAFVQSQPVARAAVQLPREAVVSAPVVRVASVAPVQQSVRGGAGEALTKPPAMAQAVVARTAPPPPPVPFAVQQAQLAARPGTPIDEAQRAQLKPAAPAVVAPKVNVVAAAPAPPASALPPATAPGGKSPQARRDGTVGGGRGEGRRPDAEKAAAETVDAANARAADAKAEASRADAARAAAANAAAASAEAAKAAAIKADAAGAAEAKAADARADATKASSARAEAGKAEAQKAESARSEAVRADASKAAAEKAEAARADAARAAEAKAADARADASKAAAIKADAARAAEATAANARADATKASSARAEASRATAERAEAARAEAAGAAKVKADAAKADAARAETAKSDAVKAKASRADAAKAATAKAEAAKAAAAKADAARADAARAGQAKAEAAKAEAGKAEAANIASARAEAAKGAAARAAAAAKSPAAATPPERRASDPKADADANPEREKKKGHKS